MDIFLLFAGLALIMFAVAAVIFAINYDPYINCKNQNSKDIDERYNKLNQSFTQRLIPEDCFNPTCHLLCHYPKCVNKSKVFFKIENGVVQEVKKDD